MKHDDQPPRRGAGPSPWDTARPRSSGPRPDKRERERLKAGGAAPLSRYSDALGGGKPPPGRSSDVRGGKPPPSRYGEAPGGKPPPSRYGEAPGGKPPGSRYADAPRAAPAAPRPELQQRHEELRLFGINACRAAFAQRPQDLRKVYLVEERIPQFKPLLAWCVQQRLGYRVVEAADLARLTASQHHEGICLEMRRHAPLPLAALLAQLPPAPAPALLALLDGVGNPHNFGAVLRSAANFGLDGLLLPADSSLGLSGAACRVAEGGAEFVPLARPQPGEDLLGALRAAGFAIAATVPRDGMPLYQAGLPARLALVFGAEGEGMSSALIEAADLRLTIPGSGKVESLNIAASAAVLFGEHYRRHHA